MTFFRSLLAATALVCTGAATAADGAYYRFDELLTSPSADDLLDPSVTLYWGEQPTPEFAEYTRPDIHSATSVSLSPFGGSRRHCIDAFEKALKGMIGDAHRHHYDAVVGIRAAVDGKPSEDANGFSCTPGYKVTRVQLVGRFAMSAESVRLASELERRSTEAPGGAPRADRLVLPLADILQSPEALAILGPKIAAYPGLEAPAYRYRYGAEIYSEDADLGKSPTREAACAKAVLNTLQAMVDDAQEKSYDAIVRIRSFVANRYAAQPGEVQCQIGKKAATVTLQASLAERS